MKEISAAEIEHSEAASEIPIVDLAQPVRSPHPQIILGDSWHSASASSTSSISSDDGFALLEMVEAEAVIRDSQYKLESLEQRLFTSSSESDSDTEFTIVPSTRQSGRSIRPSCKIESQLQQVKAAAAREAQGGENAASSYQSKDKGKGGEKGEKEAQEAKFRGIRGISTKRYII